MVEDVEIQKKKKKTQICQYPKISLPKDND